jgi:hypothetical protein
VRGIARATLPIRAFKSANEEAPFENHEQLPRGN